MKNILVLGVGNLILSDEGVGIHAIEYLRDKHLCPESDLLDGGTGGIALMGTLQEYRHVILIDATLDGNRPGTIRHIRPRFASDYPPLMSAHEIGVREMLEAMVIQENCPEIDLIAVSVKNIKEVGLHLSPEVSGSLPLIAEVIKSLIHNYKT